MTDRSCDTKNLTKLAGSGRVIKISPSTNKEFIRASQAEIILEPEIQVLHAMHGINKPYLAQCGDWKYSALYISYIDTKNSKTGLARARSSSNCNPVNTKYIVTLLRLKIENYQSTKLN